VAPRPEVHAVRFGYSDSPTVSKGVNDEREAKRMGSLRDLSASQ
jgi:hypothetical protein